MELPANTRAAFLFLKNEYLPIPVISTTPATRMSKQILKELPELVRANVISEETAQRIAAHYENQPNPTTNRLLVVFGILGGLLIGMGIVLIVAHNWDELPKAMKLGIGLLPLLVGQGIAGYIVLKNIQSRAWREGCGAFLCFAIALSISIVGQVYNIEGNFGRFLMAWMLLTLPCIYVLRSSVTAMLYIVGVTWYACEVGYFSYNFMEGSRVPWKYGPMLMLVLPFCYTEFILPGIKNNFYYFISWLLVLSLTVCLGTFQGSDQLLMMAYMSLFSLFILLSEIKLFETQRVLTNAFLVVGSLGIMGSLLILSFEWYWEDIYDNSTLHALAGDVETSVAGAVTLMAIAMLFVVLRTKSAAAINLKAYAFLVFIALFFLGIKTPGAAQLLVNLVVLVFAVYTIRDGARKNHLGILNYGLLIITGLIACRFFDTNFSFVLRGLLFIGVGVGFFAANIYMIKKRKQGA
ncbi:DUF2157 domain-containing protein [Chryseolinea soli]|nr:DUF2157 domain-containing protein [Chryseolinea soli]